MMAYQINAEKREGKGKCFNRRLRVAESVPAVLYGNGKESMVLTVPQEEVAKVLADSHARSSIITLVVKGEGEKKVLLKEVQRHPVGDFVFHVDFLEVAMDKEITVRVPVELTGTAVGIKLGGILQFNLREMPLACLPGSIPSEIKVDITALDIGDSVHVRDLTSPPGVRFLPEGGMTVASVVGVQEEEVAKPAEGEAAAAPVAGSEKAEPEVIKKGKPEEKE